VRDRDTLRYLSPEQVRPGDVDSRADVYVSGFVDTHLRLDPREEELLRRSVIASSAPGRRRR